MKPQQKTILDFSPQSKSIGLIYLFDFESASFYGPVRIELKDLSKIKIVLKRIRKLSYGSTSMLALTSRSKHSKRLYDLILEINKSKTPDLANFIIAKKDILTTIRSLMKALYSRLISRAKEKRRMLFFLIVRENNMKLELYFGQYKKAQFTLNIDKDKLSVNTVARDIDESTLIRYIHVWCDNTNNWVVDYYDKYGAKSFQNFFGLPPLYREEYPVTFVFRWGRQGLEQHIKATISWVFYYMIARKEIVIEYDRENMFYVFKDVLEKKYSLPNLVRITFLRKTFEPSKHDDFLNLALVKYLNSDEIKRYLAEALNLDIESILGKDERQKVVGRRIIYGKREAYLIFIDKSEKPIKSINLFGLPKTPSDFYVILNRENVVSIHAETRDEILRNLKRINIKLYFVHYPPNINPVKIGPFMIYNEVQLPRTLNLQFVDFITNLMRNHRYHQIQDLLVYVLLKFLIKKFNGGGTKYIYYFLCNLEKLARKNLDLKMVLIPEDENLEFKSKDILNKSDEDIANTLVSEISNQRIILIGVEDSGLVNPIKLGKDTSNDRIGGITDRIRRILSAVSRIYGNEIDLEPIIIPVGDRECIVALIGIRGTHS